MNAEAQSLAQSFRRCARNMLAWARVYRLQGDRVRAAQYLEAARIDRRQYAYWSARAQEGVRS